MLPIIHLNGYKIANPTILARIESDELRSLLFGFFVSILNPAGSGLIYSSFLGGNALTQASSIALDPGGSMWVVGITTSTDFPSSSDGGGAFVVKINASGSGIAGSLFVRKQFSVNSGVRSARGV